MKLIHKTVILFCYMTPLFSQNSVSFSMGPEFHTTQNHYKDISGVSLMYRHQLTGEAELGLRVNYSDLSYSLSSPSAENTIGVTAYDFYLLYSYAQIGPVLTIEVKPTAGTGIKMLHRESFPVDLGALGEDITPSQTKTYFSSFFSLLLLKRISSHLNLFVEPGYAFYHSNVFHNIFSIRGGIDVSFN